MILAEDWKELGKHALAGAGISSLLVFIIYMALGENGIAAAAAGAAVTLIVTAVAVNSLNDAVMDVKVNILAGLVIIAAAGLLNLRLYSSTNDFSFPVRFERRVAETSLDTVFEHTNALYLRFDDATPAINFMHYHEVRVYNQPTTTHDRVKAAPLISSDWSLIDNDIINVWVIMRESKGMMGARRLWKKDYKLGKQLSGEIERREALKAVELTAKRWGLKIPDKPVLIYWTEKPDL